MYDDIYFVRKYLRNIKIETFLSTFYIILINIVSHGNSQEKTGTQQVGKRADSRRNVKHNNVSI